MIKIAFVIDTIESPTAGTEKQLLMLIKYLDRTRFEPYLCVLRNSRWLTEEFTDCPLIDISVDTFCHYKSYVNIAKFTKFLRNNNIDIVQNYFFDGNITGVIAAKMAGVKAIVSTRRNQGYWHTSGKKVILSILNKFTTHFLANSEDTRRWVTRMENVGFERIEVIHNSLEFNRYYRANTIIREQFRTKLNFPAEAIVIGTVANLRPVKALDIFVKAAAIVASKIASARFIIVGEGSEKESLERLSHEHGIDSKLSFLGKREDVPEILSCIDIGVLTSNSESFSNAVIEYMAASLATVCTDVGGVKEAVESSETGFVIEPGDAATLADKIELLIEQNLYEGMGMKARKRANELFSHHHIVPRYQHFYEGAV